MLQEMSLVFSWIKVEEKDSILRLNKNIIFNIVSVLFMVR